MACIRTHRYISRRQTTTSRTPRWSTKRATNYWRHGYNAADRHGSLPVTHRGDDKVSNMFNDDNVNACYIM
ncbi:hypothetical protein PHJA_001398400 [Phtheirospermum japonicum]|uniref:Uncharacterized protein n=1 Tax=Phtheirospermum japonicum TaxID=374723 RepID=A0A830C314_9LAMI|nr:hypothetical protein PHJA_001398400 [Phtheirospermum japonicum]